MKVSVVVVTYNHELFLEQALDSVLSQELDHDYEVIVSEDRSTDGTGAILERYASEHQGIVRVMRSEHNLGTNEVLTRALEAATGEYVALLDGDDYWTSQAKLRTQVAFLDQRPEFSICFHNALVVYDEGDIETHPFHMNPPSERISAALPPAVSHLEDLLGGNFMQTCSVMFRRRMLPPTPDWYDGLAIADWPLYVLLAERGPIGYIDEILSAYRVHPGGLWSENISRFRRVDDLADIVQIHVVLGRHLGPRYRDRLERSARSFCEWAASTVESEGRHTDAEQIRRLPDSVFEREAL
jgi:glycosyltransferase involved in cell wall biosynthesis